MVLIGEGRFIQEKKLKKTYLGQNAIILFLKELSPKFNKFCMKKLI